MPVGGLLVLGWAKVSGTPWRDIGYVRPSRWLVDAVAGVVIGAVLKLFLKAIVMPSLGAPAINQPYHYLAGNRALVFPFLTAVVLGAGFGEETVFRGYGFERLRRLIGRGPRATAAIVLVTSLLFALAHYPNQRLPGTEQAFFAGLAFGTLYARTGRIWIAMCAHVAFDLVAYALIYWNLETAVAHWIFR